MTRSRVRILTGVAATLVVLLAAGCGEDAIVSPKGAVPLRVAVSVAPRSPASPLVGPVDSLRFDLRGPNGELLVHPTRIEVGDATDFHVSLAVPPGADRSITVMGIGDRSVLGLAPETGHGILYLGRTTGIDLKPGDIPTIPVTLHLFVPEFTDTETQGSSPTHILHWRSVPGADRYVLTRLSAGSVRSDSTVRDTVFTGHVRPMRYRVAAVDFSGLLSAPSDWITVDSGIAPALCSSPDRIDFGLSDDTGLITIRNCGTGGRVDWTLSKNIPWLDLDQVSGTVSSETDTIHVTASREGLLPGPHTGTINVSSNAGNGSITVTIDVPTAPALCVSTNALDFPAGVTQKTFNVTNCGVGGLVNWSVSDNAPWLSAFPVSGTTSTETDPVTVTVDRSGLSAGSYNGQVTVSSDAGVEVVSVSMDIPATPQLCVEPPALDFGAQLMTRNLLVTNCGDGGTVNWTASDDQPWIGAGQASGSVTTETDTIQVTVDRAGLSPGAHMGHVTVTSGAGTRIVDVTLLVPATPTLCVSTPGLDFGTNATTLPFQVTNCGTGGTLDWTVDDDQDWILTAPSAGSTTSESDGVDVTVNRNELAPGIHTGTITITSNGGTQMISVSMNVPAVPELCVSPPGLSFGANLTSLPIQVTNCGTGGTLDWSVQDSQPWLLETPTSGSTTSETDIVDVKVDRSGLPAGVYTDTLEVTSNGGTVRVPVTMNVPAVPEICLTTHVLDFGTNLTQLPFGVFNCGNGGSLNWTASEGQFWIGLLPTQGSSTGETDVVQVSVNRGQLVPGTYSAPVIVTSNAGPDTVKVILQVIDPNPVLCLSRKNLDFGLSDTTLGFVITNCGSNTLVWSTDFNVPWLQLAPGNGTTTTERDSLTVTVDRSNLALGTHTGTIFVNSNGGNATIDVSVTKGNPPVAPDGLSAAQLPGNPQIVHLSWNFVPPDADGIRIERELVTTGVFSEIAVIAADAPGYDDTLPECGEYIYRIRCFNASGNSPYSDTSNPIFWACFGIR